MIAQWVGSLMHKVPKHHRTLVEEQKLWFLLPRCLPDEPESLGSHLRSGRPQPALLPKEWPVLVCK